MASQEVIDFAEKHKKKVFILKRTQEILGRLAGYSKKNNNIVIENPCSRLVGPPDKDTSHVYYVWLLPDARHGREESIDNIVIMPTENSNTSSKKIIPEWPSICILCKSPACNLSRETICSNHNCQNYDTRSHPHSS